MGRAALHLLGAELFRRAGSAEAVMRALQEETERRRTDWRRVARPEQVLPEGDWVYWLILAGRGWGKTRTGAEAVREWNRQGHKYVNLIGATVDDARDIMVEGESGILACCPRDSRPYYRKSERKLLWPNGAESLIFTADEPERLRGKQHGKLWADELAAWRYPDSWDQAMFGLRLGRNPQAVVTTTPKPTKLVKELAADPGTRLTEGTTYDNKANLAPSFFRKIVAKYEGTRLGRQELHARILDDNPRALWNRAGLEATRLKCVPPGVQVERMITGVDPAVTAPTPGRKTDEATKNDGPDYTGIVTAFRGNDGHFYVIDDASLQDTPAAWAHRAVHRHKMLKSDRIVGEVNNGGDLVELAIRTVRDEELGLSGEFVPYSKVHASRGKAKRAEPVAALWEQGRAHLVGSFPELEDECCEFDPTLGDKQPSPDRMDAMVWAITELLEPSETGLIEFYATQAALAAAKEKQ